MAMLKCTTCDAKDVTIAILREQIEWLRKRLETPGPHIDPEPVEFTGAPYISEEEEDILTMAERNLISQHRAEQALEYIDAINPEVTIAP